MRQVDDGKGEFGGEIAFRGEFEECVCSNDAGTDIMKEMENLKIGWEGGIHEPKSLDGDRRAICLCFEGGPGTIGTVEASVRNRTPALVVQGTGRAADLIADCLSYYQMDGDWDGDDGKKGNDPPPPSEERQVLIAEFERLMGHEAEKRGQKEDAKKAFLSSDNGSRLVTAGRALFSEYRVGLDPNCEPEKVYALMEQLHGVVSSGLCLSYRMAADGGQENIQGHMSKCMLRKITMDKSPTTFERQLQEAREKRVAKPRWKSERAEDGLLLQRPDLVSLRTVRSPQKKEDNGEARKRLREEAATMVQKLQLLVGWGQTRAVRALVEDGREGGAAGGPAAGGILGELLHLALVHDQPEIVALALEKGADLHGYEPDLHCPEGGAGGPEEKPQGAGGSLTSPGGAGESSPRDLRGALPAGGRAWVQLLEGASDEPEERYLQTLIGKAQERLGAVAGGGLQCAGGPTPIGTDREAAAILNGVYAMVVAGEDAGRGPGARDLEFHFTRERSGAWAGTDFNLFLFLVLVNRSALARVFFLRDARKNTSSTLANALWACLLCRRLSKNPDVGKFSYHLKNGFETTADWYEGVAARILKAAFERSERCALRALQRPLKRCEQWTPLDLLARAECRRVMADCAELCIAAVQTRFYGEGSLVSALERMSDGVNRVLLGWQGPAEEAAGPAPAADGANVEVWASWQCMNIFDFIL